MNSTAWISGVKLNLNKCTTSSSSNSFSQDEHSCGIKTVHKFVYLWNSFQHKMVWIVSHWNDFINKMVKRIQAAKLTFPSTIGMANIINSYCLSLLWYPPPLPISKEQVNKIYNVINWAFKSKEPAFDCNKKYSSLMSRERLSHPIISPSSQVFFSVKNFFIECTPKKKESQKKFKN